MKAFMIIPPFALLFWINYKDAEEVIARIRNYVTFAALGIVFFYKRNGSQESKRRMI